LLVLSPVRAAANGRSMMSAITLLCVISDGFLLVLFVLTDERTSMATNHKDRCEPMCQRVPSTSENKKQKGTLVIRLLREKAIKNRPCL